jgi:membrane fusion protein (multidrug efflux system)
MLLNIQLSRSVDHTIMIAESAVIPIEDKHYVYIAQAGKALRVEIETGRRRPGIGEGLSGLTAGQQVVVEGTIKLTPGSALTIRGQPL